jgi:hypothetical protein
MAGGRLAIFKDCNGSGGGIEGAEARRIGGVAAV